SKGDCFDIVEAIIEKEEMDSQPKDLSGQTRFKLRKMLATSLQGGIFLAEDKRESRWVVVKRVWRELVKEGKCVEGSAVGENFEQEKSISKYLADLRNQNKGKSKKREKGLSVTNKTSYVRYIDDWEDTNCYYLAMEYCEGGDLFDYMSKCNTTKDSRVEGQTHATAEVRNSLLQSIFRQLVETVSWMHSNGVAHLDLSLENVMLQLANENGITVKIIDFGVAQRFRPNQKFNRSVGKFGYMAPEVFAQKEYSPEKADIWSLGVILFAMLVGGLPYRTPDMADPHFRAIMSGHLRTLLTMWKKISTIPTAALGMCIFFI
ncbi:hypothetical protein RFI_40259, partial [Reticulomyxa filosa]